MEKLKFKAKAYYLLFCLIILSLLITGFSSGITAAAQIEIYIPEEVMVNQAEITLGSIAKIKGVKGKKKQELKQVKLDQAPRPGYERRINKQLVDLILQDKGYSTESFTLNMPQVVIVKTASREIKGEKLLQKARSYIKSEISANSSQVDIEATHYPREVVIPDSAYEIKIKENNSNLVGRLTLPVDIMIKGKRYRRVYLGFTVKAYRQVFVAQKSIIKGDKLKKKDFIKKQKSLNDLKGKPVTSWNSPLLQDGVTSQPLGKGQVLLEQHLKKPILISWGDQIQAEVIIGSIRATTMVKAQGSGKKGDYIKVENIRTGQQFKAEIINRNLVRIVRK